MAFETDVNRTEKLDELSLMVCYLSYAMKDVRAVSDDAAYLLRLAILALEEHRAGTSTEQPQPALPH